MPIIELTTATWNNYYSVALVSYGLVTKLTI